MDAPRRAIPKYPSPFLAVLIGRHVVGVPSELRSRPSSPRGASGPRSWTLHPEVKPPAGTAARLQRLRKKCEESSAGQLDEICSPSRRAPASRRTASACKTGVTLRLACCVQTIDKRTEARPALPPRRSEAASAARGYTGFPDIPDHGVHSAAERSNRCTSAAVVTPLLPKKPTPRPRHV